MTMVVRETGEDQVGWVNASGLPVGEVRDSVDQVARQLANWVDSTRRVGRLNSLMDRAAYTPPDNPYDLMRVAQAAVENDDIVGGVVDVTGGLIHQGVKWESPEPDETDVFNQLARDLNLDEFIRAWHREETKFSQVVVGTWWDYRSYTVRGRNPETRTKRKKTFRLYVPVALTFLDPQKIVPLTPGPFGQDRLAWRATHGELEAFNAMNEGKLNDALMREFFAGKVKPTRADKEWCIKVNIDPNRLILLRSDRVFRHSRVKSSYERFPALRLKSVFPLLDLKQQLMEADRVMLVGAANYILLVRKGSKEDPAEQAELDNLKEGFSVVAKLPVIVGDHRLQIDIITPDQTHTLDADKYDTLDKRIVARCLGAILTSAGSGRETSAGALTARGIAAQLESQRLMMKRTLEREIARAVKDHPANDGALKAEPNLAFTPRNVKLDNDAQLVTAILAMRNTRDLSRDSFLEYFGFDQEIEAQRREWEQESGMDDIFQTQVPFSAPANGNGSGPNGGPEAPAASGRRGGRPTGGGNSRQSPQSQVKPKTPNGNPSTASEEQE